MKKYKRKGFWIGIGILLLFFISVLAYANINERVYYRELYERCENLNGGNALDEWEKNDKKSCENKGGCYLSCGPCDGLPNRFVWPYEAFDVAKKHIRINNGDYICAAVCTEGGCLFPI